MREKNKTPEELMDLSPDLPVDELGDAALLKDKVLQTGRLKGSTFQETYLYQKSYIEWVRQNVKATNTKFGKNFLEFSLYVACRDSNKKKRLEAEKKKTEIKGTPRSTATRRSVQESDWEEVMHLEEPQIEEPTTKELQMSLQLQLMRERLESIDQVIQNANQEKRALAHQMGQLETTRE